VNLEIDGAEEKSKLAIVQDIQRDPLTGNLVHVDFRAVNEDETIHAVIPITLNGEAAGTKAGGILEQLIHSIEVHCRPADLPERIGHNIEGLAIGEPLKVGDLEFPEGVSSHMGEDVLVAIINKARVVTETTAAEGEAAEGEAAAEGEDGAEAAAEGEGGEG